MQDRISLEDFEQAVQGLDTADNKHHWDTIRTFIEQNETPLGEDKNKEEKGGREWLVEKLNKTYSPSGQTALTAAVQASMDKEDSTAFTVVEAIIKIPGTVNAPNEEGITPLELAVSKQHPHIPMIKTLETARDLVIQEELLKKLFKKRNEQTYDWPKDVLKAAQVLRTHMAKPQIPVVTAEEFQREFGFFKTFGPKADPNHVNAAKETMKAFCSVFTNLENAERISWRTIISNYETSLIKQEIDFSRMKPMGDNPPEKRPIPNLEVEMALVDIRHKFIGELLEHMQWTKFLYQCDHTIVPAGFTHLSDINGNLTFYEETNVTPESGPSVASPSVSSSSSVTSPSASSSVSPLSTDTSSLSPSLSSSSQGGLPRTTSNLSELTEQRRKLSQSTNFPRSTSAMFSPSENPEDKRQGRPRERADSNLGRQLSQQRAKSNKKYSPERPVDGRNSLMRKFGGGGK